MSEHGNFTVLLVDADGRIRALLANQLLPLGCRVLHADNGASALDIVNKVDVRLVITELYVKAGADDDLVHAIRRDKSLRRTRTMVHTTRATAADRDWAMRAGADAYLIKPTRAERLRQVVSRLVTPRGANAKPPVTSMSPISRRDSLDGALVELERGELPGTSSIVFGRVWWTQVNRPQQAAFRKRAKRVGVTLHSDSMLGAHFVEVRGASSPEQALATERMESPYKRH